VPLLHSVNDMKVASYLLSVRIQKFLQKRRDFAVFDVRKDQKKPLRETIKFLFFLRTRLRLKKQAYRRPIPTAVRPKA
jgi:hypothetical protein